MSYNSELQINNQELSEILATLDDMAGDSRLVDSIIDRSITELVVDCTTIGSYAFYSCSELTSLTISSPTVCSLSSTSAFTNTPIASGTGYIYVPSNLVSSYKSATNWSTYAAQIKAIGT